MNKTTIYLGLVLCLFINIVKAQETFESKAKMIATKIELITKEEKAALKTEVEAVNEQLQSGTINSKQADEKKMQLAEVRAKNIETRVNAVQEELKTLVQDKVDGKIEGEYTPNSFEITYNKSKGKNKEKYIKKRDSIANLSERRTTSQFVFAAGFNNLVTNEQAAHSDYRYFGSHFYEWGVTGNSRIFKNANLLHFKYGLSVMYNNLRPTDNRSFVTDGNQTNLEVNAIHLEDSRFRNVYLVAPIHLEFDFSGKKIRNDKTIFKSHQSWRVGLGGYAGLNLKSKQILEFDANGNDVKTREKGDFNVTNAIYGISTYIGYKQTSLYVKYDLNPLFKDNAINQNNISVGIRFDFNHFE